nr:hypothetical protein [Corynebacterium xerosis]
MKLATLRIDGGTRAAVLGNGSAVLLDASCVGDLIAAEGWRAGVDAVLGDHGGDATRTAWSPNPSGRWRR